MSDMLCNLPKFYIPIKTPISDNDIDSLKSVEQYFSDCYILATLETLSHSDNGRKILKEQISYDYVNPDLINCYLYNKNGEKEKYTIPSNHAVNGYEELYKHQSDKIIRTIDISVCEYEKQNKSKPWICRLADKFRTFKFEFNLTSHFMKTFTGKEPTVNIAETSFNYNLKPYRKEVMELFERMDKDKNHSLVIGSGIKKVDGRRWHVYVLEDVNLAENKVTIKNKRGNITKTMTVEEALSDFKYITGYFNKDLA